MRLAWCVAVVVVIGCASSGGTSLSDSYWRVDMGRTTQAALHGALDKVFSKHAVVVRREQSVPGDRQLRFETEWVSRQVLATEQGAGVTDARNRIVLVANQLDMQWSGASVYRLRWQVENEVVSGGNSDWHPAVLPNEVRDTYRPVFTDLETEIRIASR